MVHYIVSCVTMDMSAVTVKSLRGKYSSGKPGVLVFIGMRIQSTYLNTVADKSASYCHTHDTHLFECVYS